VHGDGGERTAWLGAGHRANIPLVKYLFEGAKWRSHSHQSPVRAYWRRFGYPLATTLKNAQQRATMAAKEERARDAALAMQEYEAEKLAIGIKTARLRALRLAKEAESNERTKRKNPGTIPPVL
jgi:hypothetical protein